MSSFRARLVLAAAMTLAGGPAVVVASDAILSPSVMATYVLRADPSGLQRLDFLVLWRGRPNWFAGPGESRGTSRSTPDSFTSISRRAGIDLGVQVDLRTRTAVIQGVRLDLQGSNVVLVDDVDGGSRGTIAGVMQIEAGLLPTIGLSPTDRLLPVLRAVPHFAAFLRCDQRLPSVPGATNVCARLLAR